MSNNQMHGKSFEDFIKSTFRGSSDNGRTPTSIFDIEADFDKELHLDTSIKTTKKSLRNNEVFPLSDARRIFSLDNDFRMLIGLYEQKSEKKFFGCILEYIIKIENIKKLKGEISLEQIADFHNSLKAYPIGEHEAARRFHRIKNKELKDKTLITLNPKVDTKNQRRLQCSLKRQVLESILPSNQIIIHNEEFRDLQLPIVLKSSARTFK